MSKPDKIKVLEYVNFAFVGIFSIMLIQMTLHVAIEYRLNGTFIFDKAVKPYLFVIVLQLFAYVLCRYIILNSSASQRDKKTRNSY